MACAIVLTIVVSVHQDRTMRLLTKILHRVRLTRRWAAPAAATDSKDKDKPAAAEKPAAVPIAAPVGRTQSYAAPVEVRCLELFSVPLSALLRVSRSAMP
jgi:hypothetical protein